MTAFTEINSNTLNQYFLSLQITESLFLIHIQLNANCHTLQIQNYPTKGERMITTHGKPRKYHKVYFLLPMGDQTTEQE